MQDSAVNLMSFFFLALKVVVSFTIQTCCNKFYVEKKFQILVKVSNALWVLYVS